MNRLILAMGLAAIGLFALPQASRAMPVQSGAIAEASNVVQAHYARYRHRHCGGRIVYLPGHHGRYAYAPGYGRRHYGWRGEHGRMDRQVYGERREGGKMTGRSVGTQGQMNKMHSNQNSYQTSPNNKPSTDK